MIIVRITPAGVQGISFEANGGILRDPSISDWPVVHAELARLDRKVKEESRRIINVVGQGGRSQRQPQ
jgi:hypothetical protein